MLLLGDDAIHAVDNPRRAYSGAIHVYGGDFFGVPRSQWNADTYEEAPFDLQDLRREFERAEEKFNASAD